jgi:capsular exopolysaccharide synthesis family protein
LNITVIEEAITDDKPTKPAKFRLMAVAIAVGLVLGVSGGLAREWVNPTLRSEEDIKAALGVPILGLVPRVFGNTAAEAHGWAVQNEPDSALAEAYRSVRTAVTFSAPESGARTIVVTSPSGGDGKSTLVSNLAIAMAKAGKRVLILDADFRSPVQHKIFGVSDETGFSSVLSNGESIEQAVRRTEVERLDILPCGPVPRDPSEILNSPNLTSVLESLAERYDHVVIDAPETNGVSDARIVAASCDVTILVMRAEKSSRRLAENARDGLLAVGAHLLGVVMNDVPAGNRNNGSDDGVSGVPILDRAVAKLTGAQSGHGTEEVFSGSAGGISTSV